MAERLVKAPVEAEEAPIAVPSMAPPLMSNPVPSISTLPASSFLPRVIFSPLLVVTKVR